MQRQHKNVLTPVSRICSGTVLASMSVYGPAGEKIGAGEVQGQPTLMSTTGNVTRW